MQCTPKSCIYVVSEPWICVLGSLHTHTHTHLECMCPSSFLTHVLLVTLGSDLYGMNRKDRCAVLQNVRSSIVQIKLSAGIEMFYLCVVSMVAISHMGLFST